MVSVQALSNTILKKAFEENCPVTPMKLQKLLYFVYVDYLQTNNTPLLSEKFEVWQYGPVLSSAYYEFKGFGAKPITRFAQDAQGDVFVVNSKNVDIIQSVNKIWSRFKYYSGIDLSNMTHKPDTAWYKAFMAEEQYLKDEDIKNERI